MVASQKAKFDVEEPLINKASLPMSGASPPPSDQPRLVALGSRAGGGGGGRGGGFGRRGELSLILQDLEALTCGVSGDGGEEENEEDRSTVKRRHYDQADVQVRGRVYLQEK